MNNPFVEFTNGWKPKAPRFPVVKWARAGFIFVALVCVGMAGEASAASFEAPFARITNGVLVTESAMSVSAAWGDFDHDGWLDLFVGNFQGSNSLFRSNRDGTFAKITASPIATDPPRPRGGLVGRLRQ